MVMKFLSSHSYKSSETAMGKHNCPVKCLVGDSSWTDDTV